MNNKSISIRLNRLTKEFINAALSGKRTASGKKKTQTTTALEDEDNSIESVSAPFYRLRSGKRKITPSITKPAKRTKVSKDVTTVLLAKDENKSIEPAQKEENLTVAVSESIGIGDVVWAKIGGYPYWPCKVERIYGVRNQMVEVFWSNDKNSDN